MSKSGLEKRESGGDLGGTMRLGAYPAQLAGNSVVASIYGTTAISERHRHRYEVNTAYKERLEDGGLVFSGMSPDGTLPEIVERPDHPWFVGVQFHPELKSKPRSEEHTSELQSLMRISYAVFCLKKKTNRHKY